MEEASDAKKQKPTAVRGRRGFSKRKNKENKDDSQISESSAVYTTRVTKCFMDIESHMLDEGIKEALRDNGDVEDDIVSTTEMKEEEQRKKKTPVPEEQEEALALSDGEDIKLTPDVSNENLNNSSLKSRSPTPPPEPAQNSNGPRKNRRMKRNVKKAVASLTKSLSVAESQLQDTVYVPTPDKKVYVIDDDEEMTVRVEMEGKIHRFTVVVDDPFSKLISKIAARENVDDKNVMLVHNDRTLRPHDYPKSIGLRTVDIIKCHIRSNSNESFNESLSFDTDEANLIEIVVQSKHSRQKEIIKTLPDRPLLSVMKEYSNRIQKDLSQMKFWFDGDVVTGNSTPTDLELEDGDILDMQLL